jgi:arylsulfatase A-like enzyme
MKSLALTLVSFLSIVALPAADQKPNILFIAIDDLRPELGCYGSDHIKSPNIDRIAKAGLLFKRAYCQQAVCSPSRTSLMTGTRPDTTRVWDLVTHFRKTTPDVVTLGQHFKANGYFVQGMGKIYHSSLDDEPSWSVPLGKPKANNYALPENLKLDQREDKGKSKSKSGTPPNSRGPAFEAADVPDDTFQDGKVAELAVTALLDMSAKKQPFFLAVGFVKPHLPFVAPKKYWDLYDPAAIQLAPIPANSEAITAFPRNRFPPTSPANSSTVTTRRSAIPMRKSARCSTNSTVSDSAKTPSSSCGATTAGNLASTAPGRNTATPRMTPTRRCSSRSRA